MKKYSIGYKDKYGSFNKVWENGSTKKFENIEACKDFIKNLTPNTYKIMIGWKVIEEINKVSA